ncbi:MAG TPA: PDZ domain-containing protein, partial [Armatimonadota bacterium]|nr:PDZ domain-containing protein [Armatimonadota bacterium]
QVYFLSDRSGPVTLFAYDVRSRKVSQVLKNEGLDLKSASAGPGAIVYEQFGSLHLLDLERGRPRKLEIRVAGDLPAVRPRLQKVAGAISAHALSPTGARAVFEARGEIFTVPAAKGDVRNLTNTPGIAERDPAWSPDGKSIAYFSDESGEYALHVRDQTGKGDVRKIALGDSPSYYYGPVWSPDSKKIAYTDKRLNLWYLDLATGVSKKVDTNPYDNPFPILDPSWSPDSQWLTYPKQLKNRMAAVFVYSLATGQSHPVTDGMSDCRHAAFDKSGKYLYFTASTDIGPSTGWLDLSSINRPVTRSVYVAVLRKDLPSPLAPESDEEKVAEPPKAPDMPPVTPSQPTPPAGAEVRIDLENIDQRVLALPLPARNYQGLGASAAGTFVIAEEGQGTGFGPPPLTLHRFSLASRKTDRLLDGFTALTITTDGTKALYRQGDRWAIVPLAAPPAPGTGTLSLDSMEALIDPRAEWKQMYREVWRIQRDFFYDPGHHGLDLRAAEKKYEGYLDSVASRDDLNYLFREMLGELSVGHLFVDGGDRPEVKRVPGGLLGADYKVENGRYRFARIYSGENWNPQLRAPLTQPGVQVAVGDYLLEVNGREVRSTENLYRFFEGTAGRSVVLKVGPDPGGAGAREVIVVPSPNEVGLRNRAWIDSNRRKVDQLSGGRVGYVYLPDTAMGGYTNFNRYYFSQVNRQGVVLDERFNGGGAAADYIIDYMRRPLMNYWSTREGEDFTTPVGSIYGPKAMIINEYAGSGGDALPWYFRRAKIGPLVGKRTWGGLVGIYSYPALLDGGFVTAPRVAFWNPEGEWEVENQGVAPDVEVDLDPHAWLEGRDPQLEKATALVLEELKKNPPPTPRKPAYPNYHRAREAAARNRSYWA